MKDGQTASKVEDRFSWNVLPIHLLLQEILVKQDDAKFPQKKDFNFKLHTNVKMKVSGSYLRTLEL